MAAFGVMFMAGCAATTSTDGTEPSADDVEPAKPATPAAAVGVAQKAIEPQTVNALACPPKPGIVRCSCGICAYQNECRSLCSGGI